MRSEGNALKNGEPTDIFSFTTMLQHTGRFWSRISHQRTLEHPPYSPDFAPADFYLFPWLRSALKGWLFCDATDIIKNTTEELKRLSQNGFRECFQHHHSGWQKCIFAQGDYFEGNVNDCTVVHFSEIMWFRYYFEATAYIYNAYFENVCLWFDVLVWRRLREMCRF